jgi:hypothetical protein
MGARSQRVSERKILFVNWNDLDRPPVNINGYEDTPRRLTSFSTLRFARYGMDPPLRKISWVAGNRGAFMI